MTVDLAALARLTAEATPGPWLAYVDAILAGGPGESWSIAHGIEEEADAAYIAAASPDVVAKLVRVALTARDVILDWYPEGIEPVTDTPFHDALRAALAGLDR